MSGNPFLSDRVAGAYVTLVIGLFYASSLMGAGAAADVAPIVFLAIAALSTAAIILTSFTWATRYIGGEAREGIAHFIKMLGLFALVTLFTLCFAFLATLRASS